MTILDVRARANELGLTPPFRPDEWNAITNGGDLPPEAPEVTPEVAALAADLAEAEDAYNAAHEALGAIILGRQREASRHEANRGRQMITLTQLPQPADAALSEDALDQAVVVRGKCANRLMLARGRYHDAARAAETRRLNAIY